MTDEAILSALWDAKREIPFSEISVTKIKDLDRDNQQRAQQLLRDFADKPTCPIERFRITRVDSGIYKFIGSELLPVDPKTPKGLPLIDPKESLTGQSESDFPSADTENEENHALGQDDPSPDAENQAFARVSLVNLQNMNIGCLLMPLRSRIPVFSYCPGQGGFRRKQINGVGISLRRHASRDYPICRQRACVCARSVCQVPRKKPIQAHESNLAEDAR